MEDIKAVFFGSVFSILIAWIFVSEIILKS